MMEYTPKMACSDCREWFDSIAEAAQHTVEKCSERENHQMFSVSFYVVSAAEQRFERITSSIWAKVPWDYDALGAQSYGERNMVINKMAHKIVKIIDRTNPTTKKV